MSLSSTKISSCVFLLTLLALLVDTGGGIGVKYVLSALLLAWAFVLVLRNGVRRDLLVEYVILVFFLLSACYAVIRGVDVSDIYGQLSFIVFFFTLLVVQEIPRYSAADTFRNVAVVGGIFVIGTFLLILIVPASAVVLTRIGEDYRLGYLGLQSIGNSTFPVVYYRWSMWLIPALVLSIGKNNISALTIGIAAVCTLSTSIILFAAIGAGLLGLVLRSQYVYTLKIAASLLVLMLIAVNVSDIADETARTLFEFIASKLSAESTSSSIKLGHIEGVLRSVMESPINFLFGTGVGSEFLSPGIGEYTINIEPSHFNFVRQFGVVGGIVFFGYILQVAAAAFRTDALGRRWAIGLLTLFIAAGTNPLLMSPVFMVLLVTVRAYTLRYRAEETHA